MNEQDTTIAALTAASKEYGSVVQLNGYAKAPNDDKVVFTMVVCATDDLEFNARVKEQLESFVDSVQ